MPSHVRTPRLSVFLVWPFLELLRERGVSFDSLNLGPELGALDDPENRIPHAVAMRLLQMTVRGSRDPALGLHAAEQVRPGNFDVLEFAARSSGTLGEAIETSNRYLRLLHDAADFQLEIGPEKAIWVCHLRGDLEIPPAAAQLTLATMVLVGRRILGRELSPLEVHFAHEKPDNVTEYERVFQCPVRFGQKHDALVIQADDLKLPMPAADAALKAFLDKTAQQLLRGLPTADTWTDRVREQLAQELSGGEPGLSRVAKKLGVAPRTLRRRLQEEGTFYKEVLDKLRQTLAEQYLIERRLTVADVSFLLGFSEPSAFHKAYKRWTGRSPAEARR